jgi:hypothetical protein
MKSNSRKCIFCFRKLMNKNKDDYCSKCKYILFHNAGNRKIMDSLFVNGSRLIVP